MIRPLKIVHFLTDQNWTALTEEVFTLCCELTRRGHQVWIFCVPALHGLLAKKDIEHGVVIKDHLRLDLRYPIHTVIDIYRLRGFLIDERPDILHVHCSDDYWIGALANRYAATTTRLIKTLHEPSNLRLRTIHRWLYTTLTNAFVTLCKEDSRKLKQSYNIKSKPVAVIHSAVDINRFCPDYDPRPIRAEFGIGPATPVVGMVADFHSHQRHEDMIQAMLHLRKLLPTVRLILIGDGECQPVLEQLVRKLGLEHHVFFENYRNQDLPQVYAAMDVKVYLASGSGASCRTVLEAMACGIPVLAYPVGGVSEIVVDGITGYLVPEGDTKELARRLADLLGDRSTARKMGVAARQRIEESFTEDYRLRKIGEFYCSLVGSV